MNDTRQRLIDATRECLSRGGLAATTSRGIANAAGANLGAITYYFESKDRLVAAALTDGLRRWLAPAIDVLGGAGEPAERTVAAIQALLTTFEDHRGDAPLYLEALVQAPRMEALRHELLRLWTDLRRLLAEQMREMQADDLLPSWVQPDAMASLLIAVANGLVLQVTVDPDSSDLTAMSNQFGLLLLAARP